MFNIGNKENDAKTQDGSSKLSGETSRQKVRRSVLKEFDPFPPESPAPQKTRQPTVEEDEIFEDAETSLPTYICPINRSFSGVPSKTSYGTRESLLIPELKDYRPAQLVNLNDSADVSYSECVENLSQLNKSENNTTCSEDEIEFNYKPKMMPNSVKVQQEVHLDDTFAIVSTNTSENLSEDIVLNITQREEPQGSNERDKLLNQTVDGDQNISQSTKLHTEQISGSENNKERFGLPIEAESTVDLVKVKQERSTSESENEIAFVDMQFNQTFEDNSQASFGCGDVAGEDPLCFASEGVKFSRLEQTIDEKCERSIEDDQQTENPTNLNETVESCCKNVYVIFPEDDHLGIADDSIEKYINSQLDKTVESSSSTEKVVPLEDLLKLDQRDAKFSNVQYKETQASLEALENDGQAKDDSFVINAKPEPQSPGEHYEEVKDHPLTAEATEGLLKGDEAFEPKTEANVPTSTSFSIGSEEVSIQAYHETSGNDANDIGQPPNASFVISSKSGPKNSEEYYEEAEDNFSIVETLSGRTEGLESAAETFETIIVEASDPKSISLTEIEAALVEASHETTKNDDSDITQPENASFVINWPQNPKEDYKDAEDQSLILEISSGKTETLGKDARVYEAVVEASARKSIIPLVDNEAAPIQACHDTLKNCENDTTQPENDSFVIFPESWNQNLEEDHQDAEDQSLIVEVSSGKIESLGKYAGTYEAVLETSVPTSIISLIHNEAASIQASHETSKNGENYITQPENASFVINSGSGPLNLEGDHQEAEDQSLIVESSSGKTENLGEDRRKDSGTCEVVVEASVQKSLISLTDNEAASIQASQEIPKNDEKDIVQAENSSFVIISESWPQNPDEEYKDVEDESLIVETSSSKTESLGKCARTYEAVIEAHDQNSIVSLIENEAATIQASHETPKNYDYDITQPENASFVINSESLPQNPEEDHKDAEDQLKIVKSSPGKTESLGEDRGKDAGTYEALIEASIPKSIISLIDNEAALIQASRETPKNYENDIAQPENASFVINSESWPQNPEEEYKDAEDESLIVETSSSKTERLGKCDRTYEAAIEAHVQKSIVSLIENEAASIQASHETPKNDDTDITQPENASFVINSESLLQNPEEEYKDAEDESLIVETSSGKTETLGKCARTYEAVVEAHDQKSIISLIENEVSSTLTSHDSPVQVNEETLKPDPHNKTDLETLKEGNRSPEIDESDLERPMNASFIITGERSELKGSMEEITTKAEIKSQEAYVKNEADKGSTPQPLIGKTLNSTFGTTKDASNNSIFAEKQEVGGPENQNLKIDDPSEIGGKQPSVSNRPANLQSEAARAEMTIEAIASSFNQTIDVEESAIVEDVESPNASADKEQTPNEQLLESVGICKESLEFNGNVKENVVKTEQSLSTIKNEALSEETLVDSDNATNKRIQCRPHIRALRNQTQVIENPQVLKPELINKENSTTSDEKSSSEYVNSGDRLKSDVDRLQNEMVAIQTGGVQKDQVILAYALERETDRKIIFKYREQLEGYQNHVRNQCQELLALKDQSARLIRRFTTTEMAFSDVFTKYEKAKSTIEAFRTNEAILTENIETTKDQLAQLDAKCQAIQDQYNRGVIEAQQRVDREKKIREEHIVRLQAVVKRLEIKATSLETELKQKTEECRALAALCDDITGTPS